jgi:hypothetical protein
MKELLDIEKDSLISNIDNISGLSDFNGDFTERKIILLRYPAPKPRSF